MHRYILSVTVASLMMLGGAAQADDICSGLGDFPESGLCDAYCVAMDCDLLDDDNESTSPQASEAACEQVAISFYSFLEGIPRSQVVPEHAICILDNNFCWPRHDVPPPGGCF